MRQTPNTHPTQQPSAAHTLRPPINWALWASVWAAVLLHTAGAVAVARAPDDGLVELVDGMLHHLVIRDPVIIDLPATPPPPPPPPAPVPEELIAVAQVKKIDDNPGPTPAPIAEPPAKVETRDEPPTKNDPAPIPVSVRPPQPTKAPSPKAKPKPTPKPEPPKPAPEPPAVAETTPPKPSTSEAFEKAQPSPAPIATATAPTAPAAPTAPTDSAPTTAGAGGDPSAVASAAHAPQSGQPSTQPGANGSGQGGSDDIDRKGLLKSYLKEVNAAVQQRYEYPRSALRMRLEGTVVVSVTIDAQGKIVKAVISTSSGHAVLDEAALAAITSLGAVPAPPSALAWTTKTVKIPYKYSLERG